MKVTNTKYDFTDHTSAIAFVFKTAWLNQSMPIIDKDWVNLWINSIQGGFCLDIEQYYNYLEPVESCFENLDFPVENSNKKAVKNYVNASLLKSSAISWGIKNSVKNAYVRIQGFEVELSDSYDKSEPRT